MTEQHAESDALTRVLIKHVWVRDVTHRADCDCNWRTPQVNTYEAKKAHAAHVADELRAGLTEPDNHHNAALCPYCKPQQPRVASTVTSSGSDGGAS